jgi:sulfur carrier protein
MEITLNGERREHAGATLGALVAQLGIRRDGIAVALNDDVVPRAQLETTALQDGDRVEIIVAVAGG